MALEARRPAIAWKTRNFQPADIPALAEIVRSSAEASHWPLESYAKLAASPGGLLLICEAQSLVSGFLAARQTADQAEILNLAMHPNSRRKGAASALLASTLERLREANAASVFLEVRESNLPAIALYQKHGFSVSSRRKAYYRDPVEDALCLHKKLTPEMG
jgi:ribosomal-protein-alanine N-acetyltransferase